MGSYAFLAVDLSILAIIVFSGLLAYARGFAREAVTLGSLAVAAMAAYYLFPLTLPFTQRFIASDEIAAGATIALLFVAILVAALLVGHPIASRIGGSEASSADRWLGLAFGLVRGAFIVVILFMLLSFALPTGGLPGLLLEARLFPLVESTTEWLLSLMPSAFREDMVMSAAPARPVSTESWVPV